MEKNLPLKFIIPTKKRITTLKRGEFSLDSDISEYLAKISITILILGLLGGFAVHSDRLMHEISSLPHLGLLILMLFIGVVSIIAGHGFSSRKTARDNLLKIVECTDRGIRLGAGKFDIERTYFVSWNHVVAVEAVQTEKNGVKNKPYLLIENIKKEVYQLSWENAFAWIEEESFFSQVRSGAGHAKMNFAIEEVEKKDKLDNRYTNLWLHYFSSPTNRQRRGRLEAGTTLQEGAFQIIKPLSGGGQGTTYVAKYTGANGTIIDGIDLDSSVVLKEYVLPVHRSDSLEDRKYEELSAEAKILSSLDYHKIVKLYDCFVEDHRGYLVLEYIKGRSLNEIVKAQGPFDSSSVARIALSVTDILSYLHNREMPIIHRDLTPDNLMMDDNGEIKLLDFTVARESTGQRTATIVGKQAYIPPEQFRGNPVPESDIYALACTMYYLLTGSDPKPMELDSPSRIKQDVDPQLEKILLTAGAFELSERYKSAEAMAYDLRILLGQGL